NAEHDGCRHEERETPRRLAVVAGLEGVPDHHHEDLLTPPPRFPQPPVVALAVPTNSFAKICEDQNCVHTNVAPIT
ncbi:unnamed protein product, partial [Ectocarpus sp. 8 AP-2014]